MAGEIRIETKLTVSLGLSADSPGIKRAVTRAGGDALLAARAEAVRQVRARRAMKASAVRRAIELRYPRGEAPDGSRSWFLVVQPRGMPVAAYPHRQTGSGVSVQIKTGTRSLIRGAFVATMRSGHEGVFMRRGRARLPIRELYTTQIADVFRDRDFVEAVGGRAAEVFARSLGRNVALLRGR